MENSPPENLPNNPPTPQTLPPETFSREYVKELREENKATRIDREAIKAQLAEAQKQIEAINASAEERVKAAQNELNSKLLFAELRAVALNAGIVDLDGLKLADVSGLKLLEDGTGIDGADKFIADLKASKPYLFGDKRDSSSTSKPPTNNPAPAKTALEMTPEEYRAAKAAMLKQSR